ncbi:MAG: hypothetical protein H6572_05355 [Lewinellaceae bacterium]|nr:hypothetical protein [Lewinellaceae bacterium]
MKFRLVVCLFLIGLGSAYGQYNSTLLMNNSYQRNTINPAMGSPDRLVLGIPQYSINYTAGGLTVNDMVTSEIDGIRYFDFDKAYQNAGDKNFFYVDQRLEYGSIHFRMGNFSLSTGASFNTQGQLRLNKDLIGLLANGNTPYVGKTLDIGPGIFAQSFNEIYIGGRIEHKNWKFGARARILNGVQDISTPESQIKFYTNPDIYQIEMENNYLVNSSATLQFNDLTDISYDWKGISFNNFLKNNFGFALDLGVTYQFSKKLELGIALLDWGKIGWDRRLSNDLSQGNLGFAGLNLLDYVGNTEDVVLEDSIYQIFEFQKTKNPYSTKLPIRMNLTAKYALSAKMNLGFVLNYSKYEKINHSYLDFLMLYKLTKWLHIGANVGMMQMKNPIFGISGRLMIGRIEGYLCIDNALGLTNVFNSHSVQLSAGANVTLMRKKKKYVEVDELIELK